MAVNADQADMLFGKRVFDGFQGLSRLDGTAEFGIDLAGRDFNVCVRIDAGRYAQHNGGRFAFGRTDLVKVVKFGKVVGNDDTDAAFDGIFEVGNRLVVAVKMDFFGRKTGGKRGVNLTRGNRVGAQPFAVGNAVNFLKGKGFAGKENFGFFEITSRAMRVFLAHGAHFVLVENIKRRAVFLGKADRVDSGDREVAGCVDAVIVV